MSALLVFALTANAAGQSEPTGGSQHTPGPQPTAPAPPAPTPADAATEFGSGAAGLEAVVDRSRDPDGRACAGRQVVVAGNLRYVACGVAGLWVFQRDSDGSHRVLLQQEMGGSVTGLFERDGAVWARVESERPVTRPGGSESVAPGRAALPADRSASAVEPAPPHVTAGPAAPHVTGAKASPVEELPAYAQGKVVGHEPGELVIDLGRHNELSTGSRVAIYRDEVDEVAEGHTAVRTQLLLVGEVTSVAEHRARVQLGIDEQAPLGSRVVRTREPLTGGGIAAPPRPGDQWVAGFMSRPFLVLENAGIGLLGDFYIGRRFAGPLHLQVRAAPLGLGAADEGGVVSASAYGMASYDVRLFEAGLGVGAETMHDPGPLLSAGSGMGLVQFVRLGAVDGLNLTAYTHVVLFHREFAFSSLRIHGQVPLTTGTWLVFGGGGGDVGFAYGEIGLRALLAGNGRDGSLILTGVGGAGGLFRDDQCFEAECLEFDFARQNDNVAYLGPMIGIGLEWRWE